MTTTVFLDKYLESYYLEQPYLEEGSVSGLIAGMQALMVSPKRLGMQATLATYNISQLRILCSFPSRGTPGQGGINWTANDQASGDFSVNNVNTDIPEQVYRSTVATNIQLKCDSGLSQGVYIDTLAILNHNLTKSATVTLQQANNAAFSPIAVSIPLTVKLNNIYYISPSLPTAGYRYTRFVINDPSNPDGYIEIGIIVFGSASIFSLRDSFINPITPGQTHFKDVIQTEGFTNISNDRALRNRLSLSFPNLHRDEYNLSILQTVFDNARTSLKCLWIPTPDAPERFAVFGKLTQLPDRPTRDHGDEGGYTSIDLEIDESL